MNAVFAHLLDAASPAALAGLAAVVIGIVWPLFRSRSAMLAGQAAGGALFAVNFALLGSYTGAINCLVAIVQSAIAWKVRDRRLVLALYAGTLVVVAVGAAETWIGAASFCAVVGTLLATAGRLTGDARAMRVWFLFCSLAWIGHNVLVGSFFGLMSDALAVAAAVAGILRDGWPRREALAAA